MTSRTRSIGNWIASASYKPDFATGEARGTIAALGYMQVGEIVELPALRLLECRGGVVGAEIPGFPEAEAWEPWEVRLENDRMAVWRSTSWEDCHLQRWMLKGDRGMDEIVLLVEFALVQPGRLLVGEDGTAWWETESGDVVALACAGGDILAVAAGRDEPWVRERLACGGTISQWEQGSGGAWLWNGVLGIRMHEGREGRLILAAGRNRREAEERLARTAARPEEVVRESKRGWEQFFGEEIPACPTDDPRRMGLWREAWYLLRANRMDYARAPLLKPFGSPSKFNYRHQWLWDSAFHAVVWRWARHAEWGREEMSNLLENPQEDGRICHEIFHTPWLNWGEGLRGRSHFAPTSQPPVLAMAVEKVYERSGDRQWLMWAWPRLEAGLRWWAIARDPNHDGLAGWGGGWESGLDDSPRWDHVMRKGSPFFPAPVEATELNALLVNEWRTLSRLARVLGKTQEAEVCHLRAEQIKAAMRGKLWDAEEGFFYCRDHEEKPIRVKTVGGLLGMLALDPGDPEVDALVAHLTAPDEFWTEYPVPSVARNEKTFTRGQMWRGPTWVNTNWLLIRALERLGRKDLARELSERTLRMLTSGGEAKLYEWFDPISGQALGNMDYGWSTLAVDLLMEPVG